MKVIKTRAVNAALRTLDDADRRKVLSWFDQLGNWENDEHVRKMAKPTVERHTYALNTSDDMRIFFTLNESEREIVIVDLARPSRFAAAGVTLE
jgi:mRNA-degrading endonuclease RelE of RelBE toxin-antitoxin system